LHTCLADTHFIDYDLARYGVGPTKYRTGDEHGNSYFSDVNQSDYEDVYIYFRVRVMTFNTTFNNISLIS